MKPNKDVAHLSTVHANASIYFDQNEPIDTPNIFNTIDDSSPEVNGSVISGTESTDSVTLSVLATDTGSGVKHVDIFELQGNSLSLLQGGVTENIFLVKLKLGESKRLLPVAVDQVGNRPKLTEIEKESAINVTSTIQSGTCDCSGHGNCSARMQVCLCDEGFYGPSCNSTSPPPEPPLLELKSKAGFTNEPVELTISARNLSGCLDEIQIFLSGMPDGTSFSKGIVQNDSTILLLSTDFGQLNMTTNSTGEHSLKILVTQFTNGTNFTRSGELQIMIYPKIENASFEFDGCFSEDSKGEIVARLNSSVILSSEQQTFLNNESTSIPHSVTLTVPTWARPLETFKSGSVYRIEDTVKGYFLKLNGRFEPFNVTVDVKIEPDGVPSAAYSKQFEVSRFCYGECREHDYGVKCNYTCDCDWDNTVECNKFNGSCSCSRQWKGMACDEFACPCVVNNTEECEPENQTCECKGGWEGKGCDIDIDECLNNTICDAHNNTGCQNRDWGYDCLCLIGYQLENDTCIEEIDTVNTTMLTENPEEKITTVSLHLNIQVPNTVNLKVAVTFEIYKKKSTEMLEIYYAEKLGDNFIKVIINSISKGSLIIDHTVITRKTEEGAQVLAMAVAEMMTDNSSLTFDGQPVNVSDITLDNTTVTNNLCDVYTRINPCGLTKCVTDNGKPACR
ncbi:uncharacterized protein LOC128555229 [Mercenaria mercenaria]|uniref:uncharacterized protein LOC128555229 n=1 Tax=Mercenaria mercenaria TaxID=6596 RepID=UPI00234E7C72|nr:uncharacterized protein LOC128555229 [Mercenaria mercenaria]